MKKGFYNSRKQRTLAVLADQRPRSVPAIARLAGIKPTRRAYAYLGHLAESGLIEIERDPYRKIYCRITERGLNRLRWLRSRTPLGPVEQLLKKFLGQS